MFCLPSSTFSREFAFWLFTSYAHGQVDVCKTWTPGSWTTPMDLQSWPGLLEAWLVLTSVKYHGNLYILIPVNQWIASTRLRATGPRTKVLGTVLQYSYFSVISRFPLKTAHPVSKSSCSSPSPHPIQSWNSEKILDTRIQNCLWGEGRGWACVNWKMPQKCKSVPRLLSTIVVHGSLCGPGHELPLWTTLIFKDEFC